jgi:hypothetical protein
MLTTSRDASLARANLELVGLDHHVVVEYLAGYRVLPALELRDRVHRACDNRTGLVSLWHITTQCGLGERRTISLLLTVNVYGRRVPAWDRQIDDVFQRASTQNDHRGPADLLARVLEPMIQRELLHRRVIGEKRGYDAKIIGWLEVV